MSELCDICRAADPFEPWLEVSVSGIFERSIHRCRVCGFRQIRPKLTRDEVGRLYPAEYFDATSTIGYGDYARQAQRRAREAYFLSRRLRRGRNTARVLEVGCALGFLLSALRDSGCQVDGVDASTFAAYYAQTRFDMQVVCGTLEDAGFADSTFDLVIQKDLLEHVSDPRTHLVETARVMASGAELWLITPNGEANLRPIASQDGASDGGVPLLDQGHLSFFSERHLRALFTECGFEVMSARTVGVCRGLKALGWLPGQRRFARRVSRGSTETVGVPDPTRYESLARRIDEDTALRHRWIRGWPPYYLFHRFWKRIDALPAQIGIGYDFEFWLRRR